MPEQSYEKHSRIIPAYHYVALPILLINVFVAVYAAWNQGFAKTPLWNVVVAIALFLIGWYSRAMPVAAQDRLIRLEERLRLREALPEHLRGRVNEIPPKHLVGLRFASDEEVAGLAERCLNGEFKTSKEVKAAIKTWRPDHLRV